MTAPTFAACVATPDIVTRRFAERAEAGQLAPGEQAPAALFRAVMLRELPAVSASPDGMSDDGEDKPERYPFVMSMATPDGAHDIVEQGWMLERFLQNPIGLYNHRSWEFPIGKWENVRVEGGMLRGDFVPTPVEGHTEAAIVAGLLKAGTLRAASVGFIPGTVTERSKFPTTHAYYADRGLVYGAPVLLECSIVNIPMHPDATTGRAADPAPAPVEPPPATPVEPDEPDTFDFDAVARALDGLSAAEPEAEADPLADIDLDALAAELSAILPVSVH